jgi:hydroxymethylpyrimidine pyrophosphatase-like HAD family hydrolase
MLKGIIALDIDGTLTAEKAAIPADVVAYLHHLQQDGWLLVFITGRTFQWAQQSLHVLKFPYDLAIQNGALILAMPSRKILIKRYLDKSIFPMMDQACEGEPTDYVIFSGFDHQDICYYRSHRFDPQLLKYVQSRRSLLIENWIDVPSYDQLPIPDFASVKSFGALQSLQRISQRIEAHTPLHAPLVKDPFKEGYYVLQASHPHVSKGESVKALKEKFGGHLPVIAAGDDENDRTMFEEADIVVVMETAEAPILELADVVASSAAKSGLIQGLQEAQERLNG